MAFNKLSKVKFLSQGRTASRNSSSYRYQSCSVVNDGDISRLSFKRYASYYVPSSASVDYVLPAGKESRLDVVANEWYGEARMFWAIAVFNRWMCLNPLRFLADALLRIPKAEFISNKVKK